MCLHKDPHLPFPLAFFLAQACGTSKNQKMSIEELLLEVRSFSARFGELQADINVLKTKEEACADQEAARVRTEEEQERARAEEARVRAEEEAKEAEAARARAEEEARESRC